MSKYPRYERVQLSEMYINILRNLKAKRITGYYYDYWIKENGDYAETVLVPVAPLKMREVPTQRDEKGNRYVMLRHLDGIYRRKSLKTLLSDYDIDNLPNGSEMSEMMPIDGFGGEYYASKSGEIYVLRDNKLRKLNKFLKPNRNKKKKTLYYYVSLKSQSGKRIHKCVHRLVLSAFSPGGLSRYLEVHHIDFDSLNNRPSNLIALTRKEHKRIHNERGNI